MKTIELTDKQIISINKSLQMSIARQERKVRRLKRIRMEYVNGLRIPPNVKEGLTMDEMIDARNEAVRRISDSIMRQRVVLHLYRDTQRLMNV